jgi:hypothetical protein
MIDFAHGNRRSIRDIDWSFKVRVQQGNECARNIVHVKKIAFPVSAANFDPV